MLAAINFNPIKSINSLIQPLGLAVSSKQQIINKIALVTFALIACNQISQEMGVNAANLQSCLNDCATNSKSQFEYNNCASNCRYFYG
ncbi:MAG: hypothetical protein ACRDDW_07080 [Candidatus Rhabdochlamydia sp.]